MILILLPHACTTLICIRAILHSSIVIKLRLSVLAMAQRRTCERSHVGVVDVYKYNDVAKGVLSAYG